MLLLRTDYVSSCAFNWCTFTFYFFPNLAPGISIVSQKPMIYEYYKTSTNFRQISRISNSNWRSLDFQLTLGWVPCVRVGACSVVSDSSWPCCTLDCLLSLSCYAVSDSLRPHGLQPARLPFPSLSPGVFSNAWKIPKRDPKLIGLICKERFGRFSENPDKFRDEFVSLGLAVSLTWQDITVFQAHCCTWDETEHIRIKAGERTDGFLPPTHNKFTKWKRCSPRTWPTPGLWRVCKPA